MNTLQSAGRGGKGMMGPSKKGRGGRSGGLGNRTGGRTGPQQRGGWGYDNNPYGTKTNQYSNNQGNNPGSQYGGQLGGKSQGGPSFKSR